MLSCSSNAVTCDAITCYEEPATFATKTLDGSGEATDTVNDDSGVSCACNAILAAMHQLHAPQHHSTAVAKLPAQRTRVVVYLVLAALRHVMQAFVARHQLYVPQRHSTIRLQLRRLYGITLFDYGNTAKKGSGV